MIKKALGWLWLLFFAGILFFAIMFITYHDTPSKIPFYGFVAKVFKIDTTSAGKTLAADLAGYNQHLAKYDKIKVGMSYEQVVEIMGAPGEKITPARKSATENPIYSWGDTENMTQVGLRYDNKVTIKSFSCNPAKYKQPPVATLTKYNQIQEGMSYDEIKEIMGTSGFMWKTEELYDKIIGNKSDAYAWWQNNGSALWMSVSFRDGKVSLKDQPYVGWLK